MTRKIEVFLDQVVHNDPRLLGVLIRRTRERLSEIEREPLRAKARRELPRRSS